MQRGSLSTRRLVTILLTVVFGIMSITGKIGSTEFMTVFTIIIGFYFGGSTALDDPLSKRKGVENNDNKTT